MKTARFLAPLLSALLLTACNDFDRKLDAGCDNDAGWCTRPQEMGGCTLPIVAGCVGQGAWCWEQPSSLGLTDVASIWGRSDNDFFIAGSGGVIAHWNGNAWQRVQVDIPLVDATRYEPRVYVMLCREQGFVLAGDSMAVFLQHDGGWEIDGDIVRRYAGSQLGDTVALLQDSSSTVDLITPGRAWRKHEREGRADRTVTSVLLREDGPHLSFTSGNGSGIWLPDGGDATLALRNGMLDSSPLDFSSLRGTPIIGFRDGRVLQAEGSGWSELAKLDVPFVAEAIVAATYDDGGVDWWATGSGNRVFHASYDVGADEVYVRTSEFARTAWLTPSKNFISVGANGRVVQVTPLRRITELGSRPEPELRDLAATDDEVVAIAQGVTWWRYDDAWHRLEHTDGYARRGVALRDGEACTVDAEGRVVALTKTGESNELFRLDAGSDDAVRGGAVGVSEGELRVTVGGVVGIETTNGWKQFSLNAGTVSIDLVPTSDGAWVAVATPEGSGSDVVNGRVVFVDEAGTTIECQLPTAATTGGIYSLARTSNGVLAAGRGWAGKCDVAGNYVALTPLPPMPSFVAIYEDAVRTTWLVTNDGRVYSRRMGTSVFSRDRSPGGWSDQTNIVTHRLTGNSTSLWLGVGTGGVMRRPLQ